MTRRLIGSAKCGWPYTKTLLPAQQKIEIPLGSSSKIQTRHATSREKNGNSQRAGIDEHRVIAISSAHITPNHYVDTEEKVTKLQHWRGV